MARTLLCLVLLVCSLLSRIISSESVAHDQETAFTKWFLENGGELNGISLAQFPLMGRGFAATKNIVENERILHIPHKLIFSTKNMANYLDDRTRKILETLGADAALSAWLLLEKHNEKSFFKPYIDVMPKYVSSLVYFNTGELVELQTASLTKEAIEMQNSARVDYEAFLIAYESIMKQRGVTITSESTISYEEYLWAMSMFNSRGLRFQGPVYMAPMADIFNYQHHPSPRPPNNGDFFAKHHKLDKQGITIFSDRDHHSTAANPLQVYEDYGDNSDEIYFKYHGFVPDTNPFRCAVLSFDEILTELLPLLPAGDLQSQSPLSEASKTVLVSNVSTAHQALIAALEFNRLPSKCVDAVVTTTTSSTDTTATTTTSTTTIGGYLGKGLEVLLIALSMTADEAKQCNQHIKENSSSKNSNRNTAKNWPAIFQKCQFASVEKFLQNVRTIGYSHLPETEHQSNNNLKDRTLLTIQNFINMNIKKDNITTTVQEDALLLQSLTTALAAEYTHAGYHQYLAVKYRYYRKGLLLSVARQYGAVEAEYILVANSSSTDTTTTTTTDTTITASSNNSDDDQNNQEDTINLLSGSGESLSSATTEDNNKIKERIPILPRTAPLSERIKVFNNWFHSLHPQPCLIEAREVPNYRIGTIVTQSIKKNDIYLGISTSHGGILDSNTALNTLHNNNTNSTISSLLQRLITLYPKQRDDFHELLFFLLYELHINREDSFYWPYLSLLPSYDNMKENEFIPLLWQEEDIKTYLGPSDIVGLIRDYQVKTKNRYISLTKTPAVMEFFEKESQQRGLDNVFTFEHYQWATVILDSRSIWWAGRRHLVPMLDFINCQEHVQDRSVLHSTVLDEQGDYAVTRAGSSFF